MELSKKEKDLILFLVKRELRDLIDAEKDIRPPVGFLAAEEKYETFLEDLLKKLE